MVFRFLFKRIDCKSALLWSLLMMVKDLLLTQKQKHSIKKGIENQLQIDNQYLLRNDAVKPTYFFVLKTL
jgi:hypothetical protein